MEQVHTGYVVHSDVANFRALQILQGGGGSSEFAKGGMLIRKEGGVLE